MTSSRRSTRSTPRSRPWTSPWSLANDVVNPVARTGPSSPIAGMPIIDVHKCHTVVVVKRSLNPGLAGIPNSLFAAHNTLIFVNDGKKAFLELVAAVKES